MEKVEVNTNLEYSRRKLADLKEYEGNARTHNKEQIMQIANSMMETVGLRQCLLMKTI